MKTNRTTNLPALSTCPTRPRFPATIHSPNRMLSPGLPMALLAALALMPVGRAAGQTFTVLKSFGILTNVTGFNPQSTLVQGTDGTLYGTTTSSEGNFNVFKIQPDGSGFTAFTNGPGLACFLTLSGNTLYGTGGDAVFKLNTDETGYTVLKTFTGSDGYGPNGLVLSGSTLYGTTRMGGPSFAPGGINYGSGTVFSVNTDGTGFTSLYSFSALSPCCPAVNGDGAYPQADLVLSGSTLYGTTSGGGGSGQGTLFSINTDGTGFTVLWDFSYSDGGSPNSLALSGSTLYGTTYQGGSSGAGTVFSINTDGTGYTVLRNFTGSDGMEPVGLMLSGNTLYGTTYQGGSSVGVNGGDGTVFKVNTDGTGYTVLRNFSTSAGANPLAGLTLSGGTLYGTTAYTCGYACGYGTVFRLNTNATGYTVLKTFAPSDGWSPRAAVALSGGTLYGTTYSGGSSNYGTVFKLNTDGTTYTALKNFTRPDGGNTGVNAWLTVSGDTLYGTTDSCGSWGGGTVFKLNTNGTGYTVLKNFGSGSDAAWPGAGLTLLGSTLYGTTRYGGSSNQGTVFKINTDGTGYTLLKNLTGSPDGAYPFAGLTWSGSTLYGTTSYGGSSNYGTVFSINTNGTGYTVLWSFSGSDGASPNAVTLAGNILYGTTYSGGSSNYGTVFSINTDGTGYAVLKNFTFTSSDGATPYAGVTWSGSTLYGTTSYGGSSNYGTVFSINTNGTGYTVVWNFSGSDGASPQAGLTSFGSILYGTTSGGGTLDEGVIFSLNLAPPPPKLFIAPDGFGGYFIDAQGQPNFSCELQRASSLTGPWITSASQTADGSGLIQFHDLFPPPDRAFYRTVQQ